MKSHRIQNTWEINGREEENTHIQTNESTDDSAKSMLNRLTHRENGNNSNEDAYETEKGKIKTIERQGANAVEMARVKWKIFGVKTDEGNMQS